MVKYVMVSVLFLFTCCKSVQIVSEKSDFKKEDITRFNKEFEANVSFLIFTSGFKNDSIAIYQNKQLILAEKLTTPITLAKAKSLAVNELNTDIRCFDKRIFLSSKKLKKYKFVYIKKEKERFVVVFSNNIRRFM